MLVRNLEEQETIQFHLFSNIISLCAVDFCSSIDNVFTHTHSLSLHHPSIFHDIFFYWRF